MQLQFAEVLTNVRKSFLKLCAKPDTVDASALDHTKLVITSNDLHGWLVTHGVSVLATCNTFTEWMVYIALRFVLLCFFHVLD